MHEWKPEWDQRLGQPPFKERRFGIEMMERVEERIRTAERSRLRSRWSRTVAFVLPAMLVLLGVGIWFGSHAAYVTAPDPPGPGPVHQGGGTIQTGIQPGDGGNYDWWGSPENETREGSDRTIVTLAAALMKREIGIWGGPSPEIWAAPDVKQPLERYDVSSPWVYEVYVDEVNSIKDNIEMDNRDTGSTVYELRLMLRDSIPMVYEEAIEVTVSNDTRMITWIELMTTDDTGTPLDEFEERDSR